MQDMRGPTTEVATTSNRSKLLGGAIVAAGVIGLGVFAYAAGAFTTHPSPARQVALNQLPATAPVVPQSQPSTAPPATTPLDDTPLAPQPRAAHEPSSDADQQAKGNLDNSDSSGSQPTTPPPAAAPAENAVPSQSAPQPGAPDQTAPSDQDQTTPQPPQ